MGMVRVLYCKLLHQKPVTILPCLTSTHHNKYRNVTQRFVESGEAAVRRALGDSGEVAVRRALGDLRREASPVSADAIQRSGRSFFVLGGFFLLTEEGFICQGPDLFAFPPNAVRSAHPEDVPALSARDLYETLVILTFMAGSRICS